MPRVIYLGLQAFAHEPHQLLSAVENPLACESLVDISEADAQALSSIYLLSTLNDEDAVKLRAWCKHDSERQVMIAWPQPSAWLAARLASGAVAEEALNDWLAQAKRLLALFRSARRQITLVGYSPGRTSKLIDALLDIPTTATDKAIYQLAAAYLCGQTQPLQDTYAYLLASSQESPVEESQEATIAQAALNEYHALQAASEKGQRDGRTLQQAESLQEQQQQNIARLKGELTAAREEHAVVFQQLQSVQSSLAESVDEQKKNAEQREHECSKRLEELQQQTKALQKEGAQLLSTLQHVQQAYETLSQEHQALAARKNNEICQQQQRIHHLESLIQWLRVHAQRHAAVAYRDSRSYKKELPKQLAMLEATPFFDADWYLAQYPDVAKSGIKPAEHFIKFGAIDGRHPSSQFSTDFYLTHYKDVAASGQHPLLHYLRHGIAEQRKTQPPQHHLPAPKKPTEGADA